MKLTFAKKLFVSLAATMACSFYAFASDQNELLAIRRIATCYYEKDFPLSHRLIDDFLTKYPSSTYLEQIYLLLADIFLQEKKWEEALALYQYVQDPILIEQSLMQRLHCLYSLKKFQALKSLIEPKLDYLKERPLSDQECILFYYAEALFKEAPQLLSLSDLEQISPYYENLLNSSFAPYAKINLAHLYALQNKHTEASTFFLESANLFPEQKEALLFAAAKHQCNFDIKSASNTYFQIHALEQNCHQEAFFNWVALLSQTDSAEELLRIKDELLSKVPANRATETNLILAKVLFRKSQYLEAISYIDRCISDPLISKNQLREASFAGILSSYHLADMNCFETYFDLIEKNFKHHDEYAESLFWKGKLLFNSNELLKAEQAFKKVIKINYPPLIAAAVYQTGVCHYLLHHFQKSRLYFMELIQKYPDCAYVKSSVSYLLQSFFMQLNKKGSPKTKIKEQLIQAHYLALNTPDFFEEEQKPQIYLSIAKLYLDLKQIDNFNQCLNSFLSTYPDNDRCYQAYLLFAAAAKQNLEAPTQYIHYLEKAILSNPPIEAQPSIYTDLFYSYLEQINDSSAFDYTYEKAFLVFEKIAKLNAPIPKNILLWFCQKYFQEVEEIKNTLFEENDNRSKFHNVSLLLSQFFEIFPETTSPEEQYLKLYYIKSLGYEHHFKEKLHCINSFKQSLDPSATLYLQAMLEEAQAYEALDDLSTSKKIYEKLLSPQNFSTPSICALSKLRLARLFAHELPNSNIVDTLYQDIHVARSLKNEPVHLEAALDHALYDHRNDLENQKYNSYLAALENIKSDFSADDTLINKEYHDMRKELPDYNAIYTNYMNLINLRILHMKMRVENNDTERYLSEVQTLIDTFGQKTLTPYLKFMIHQELQAIELPALSKNFISSYFPRGLDL